MGGAVVKRTVGFVKDFAFTAEVTFTTALGTTVTVRDEGHTEWGALERAKAKARATLTGYKRAVGFSGEGYRDTERNGAAFAFGFT